MPEEKLVPLNVSILEGQAPRIENRRKELKVRSTAEAVRHIFQEYFDGRKAKK